MMCACAWCHKAERTSSTTAIVRHAIDPGGTTLLLQAYYVADDVSACRVQWAADQPHADTSSFALP